MVSYIWIVGCNKKYNQNKACCLNAGIFFEQDQYKGWSEGLWMNRKKGDL